MGDDSKPRKRIRKDEYRYVRIRVGETTKVFKLSAIYKCFKNVGLGQVAFPFEYNIFDYITDHYAVVVNIPEIKLLMDWYHEKVKPSVNNEYQAILEMDRGRWSKGKHFMTVTKRLICEAECDPEKCINKIDTVYNKCPKKISKAEANRFVKLAELGRAIAKLKTSEIEDLLNQVTSKKE